MKLHDSILILRSRFRSCCRCGCSEWARNMIKTMHRKICFIDSYVDDVVIHASPGQLQRITSETKNLKQYCDDCESWLSNAIAHTT